MEVGHGQDVGALSHTPWAIKKRPASPLDVGTHAFKRTFHSVGLGNPALSLPYWCRPSSLDNAGSGWELGTTIDHPLIYPDLSNRLPYLQPSLYSPPPEFYTTRASDHHHLAGSGGETGSVLHAQPLAHLPETEPHCYEPPQATSTTDIASPGLPLALGTWILPLGPSPACAHDHTPPYTPSLSVTGGSDAAYLPSDMHASIVGDVNGPDQPPPAYPHARHAQDDASGHNQWSHHIDRLPLDGAAATMETIDYNQCSLPPVSYVGYSPGSSHSLNAFTEPPNSFHPQGLVDYSLAPTMAEGNPHTPFNAESRHGSMSLHQTGEDHNPWYGHDSLSIRVASVEQIERQVPAFGPYVGVVHASDEPDHGQDDGTAFSDVDEIVAAEDDQLVETRKVKRSVSNNSSGTYWDSSPGTCSGSSSVEDLPSGALPAGRSSYVHLPSPDTVQYGRDQNGTSTVEQRKPLPISSAKSRAAIDYVQETPAHQQTKPKRRKERSRFDRKALDETNDTRKSHACVTCRKQRIRCIANKDNKSAPCEKCQGSTTSRSGKITHRALCVRTETLTNIVIVRPGELKLTRRSESAALIRIPPADWADDTIRTITVSQGLSKRPFEFKVRRFIPRDGDVTVKYWNDNGTPKHIQLEPYCLDNIDETADYFRRYLFETALEGLRDAAGLHSGPLVRKTYNMVFLHGHRLHKQSEEGPDKERFQKEREFFFAVLKLVWCIRHMTGSVWIEGEEKLGMTVPRDDNYPLKNPKTGENEVPLPRMIVAQVDSIQNQKILPEQLKKVLRQLEQRLSAAKEDWFSVYLAVFMILHEISVASKDRYRWARERGHRKRYGAGEHAALGKYVENFQRASVPLLAYWSYYRVDNVGEVDFKNLSKTNKIKTLGSEQISFLEESVRMLREEAKHIPKTVEEGCWEHELFFVNRMFMHDWLDNYRTFQFEDEAKE